METPFQVLEKLLPFEITWYAVGGWCKADVLRILVRPDGTSEELVLDLSDVRIFTGRSWLVRPWKTENVQEQLRLSWPEIASALTRLSETHLRAQVPYECLIRFRKKERR